MNPLKYTYSCYFPTRILPSHIQRYGLPWWLIGKESACQCRRCGFDLWVRKIHWRRKWQPTPVFLPGESPWTEESGGLQSMGSQKVGLSIPLISCQVVGLLILRTFSGPLILPQVVFWLVLPWLAIVQIHRLELMEGYNSSQDSWLESWLQEMWDRKAS